MTVLQDGYTPPAEELARIGGLRTMAPNAHTDAIEVHKDHEQRELRGSLSDHAPDLKDTRGTHELHERVAAPDTEPHGMYWSRDEHGALRLRPHDWYVRLIAVQADEIFQLTRDSAANDEEIVKLYTATGAALREYLDCRNQINSMVVSRKVRQELDDASYQFCQAAKYKSDAEEKARFIIERDGDILDNEQINQLINRAHEAAHEGFVIAYAIQSIGYCEQMNFLASSRRVIEYSCRKLTEWYAQRRRNSEGQKQASNAAGRAILDNLFKRPRK